MIKDEIAELLRQAADEAQRRNLLPPLAMPEILVERLRTRNMGIMPALWH